MHQPSNTMLHRFLDHCHALLADVPAYVLTAMGTALASVMALAADAWASLLGQLPGPAEAAQWDERGYLIVAIMVLFTSLATVITWVATKGIQAFTNLTDALNQVKDTLEKQNDYFDDVARNAVRSALSAPPGGK